MQQNNRTPRFSVSETPLITEYLELIWQRHPRLRDSKAETVALALGAYALQSSAPVAQLPVSDAATGAASDTGHFDNYDELDL